MVIVLSGDYPMVPLSSRSTFKKKFFHCLEVSPLQSFVQLFPVGIRVYVLQVGTCYLIFSNVFRSEATRNLPLLHLHIAPYPYLVLKVSTNEKRGGLKVVSFDRSCFKLFTLRFLKTNQCRPPTL